MRKYYVYAWARSDTGDIFYIGKGVGKRLHETSRRSNRFKMLLAELASRNVVVSAFILHDGLTESEAFDLERKEIFEIGRLDHGAGPLINMTDGGEGASGRPCSEEARRNKSAANIRRFKRPGELEKHAEAIKASMADPAQRTARSEKMKAFYEDPSKRDAVSKATKKRYEDPQEREKTAKAWKLYYSDQSARQRRSEVVRTSPPTSANTSGFRGVSYCKRRNKWRVSIRINGKSVHVGYYDDKVYAAKKYDESAVQAWGENCYTNFDRVGENDNKPPKPPSTTAPPLPGCV